MEKHWITGLAFVAVTKTLNCNDSRCITTTDGTKTIFGMYQDYTQQVVTWRNVGETWGVEPGTVRLCEEGDFVTYFIIHNPEDPTYAKSVSVDPWF